MPHPPMGFGVIFTNLIQTYFRPYFRILPDFVSFFQSNLYSYHRQNSMENLIYFLSFWCLGHNNEKFDWLKF
jgi:hypothetical protein